jgi:PTS system nitrogen regulatory IIA component
MVPLREQCVILELEAKNKEGVLLELASVVHEKCPKISLDIINRVLSEREQLGSTGVGNGVAIPHGKIPGLDKLLLCFGRSSAGVGFDAVDNRPVNLFVMILSPVDLAADYLQTLARVSRLLKDSTIRNRLVQEKEAKGIVELFNQKTQQER